MCGFCLTINDDSVNIHALTDHIRHRGPDSTKYFVDDNVRCGFNRLSIVDLDERSDQPMIDASGRYLLLFNGEVYNYKALALQLQSRYEVQLITESDTEILLEGLKHEGMNFVSRLDGIFAFAFVDLLSMEVLIARDAFGVKPLYYFSSNDRLYVSSELALLRHLSGNAFDLANLARYLSLGFVDGGTSIVKGVNELPPNTVRLFSKGRAMQTKTIHDFVYDVPSAKLDLDEIAATLARTIDSQKPSIPYGVLFSGGLDSTLLLDRCFEDSNFSAPYSVDVNHPDMSERQWQDQVTAPRGIENTQRIQLNKEHLSLENIAQISKGLDYPLFHPNFVGSYLISRQAKLNGLKVLLSGEGADEVFMGYKWFFSSHPVSDFLEYVPLSDLHAALATSPLDEAYAPGMSLVETFQKVYLRRWLLRQDLTGMANSIEIRVPFLGLELVDLLNRIPFDVKRGNGNSKWIIKKILEGKFPQSFLERKKVGFDFPLNDWIGDEHLDFLYRCGSLIDPAVLTSLLNKHEGSFYKNRLIFSLVCLSVWLNQTAPTASKSIAILPTQSNYA